MHANLIFICIALKWPVPLPEPLAFSEMLQLADRDPHKVSDSRISDSTYNGCNKNSNSRIKHSHMEQAL